MRRAGKLLLSWGLVAAITLSALEVVCRLLDPLGISYYPETARWLDTLDVRRPVGYRNHPGTRGTFYGAAVRINSLGLRGPEIPGKAAGEFRILLMGDSFVFGIGVSEDDTLAPRLERRLQADASPGRRVHVINMGTVSYNTEQELRQLQEVGLALQPDLVLLCYAVNDVEPVMWVFDKRSNPVTDLMQRSYAGSLLAVLARNVKNAVTGGSTLNWDAYRADSPAWRGVDGALTEMNRVCRQAGIPFVVFHNFEDVPPLRTLLSAVGRREGFPVLEVFQRDDSRYAGIDPRKLVNSAMDSHPNVEGTRMWAELLRDALRGHLGAWRF